MSDSNLTDKISETITNVFKKTQIFEKTEKIKIYINLFMIISSVIGLTSIYINYNNLSKIKILEEKIKQSENVLIYNIEFNRNQNQIIYKRLIEQFKIELGISSKLIDKIKELQHLKPEMLSASTSISSFSPLRINLPSENEVWNLEKNTINELDDNELINECYDSIPLNNLKKITGLNWLFR
jgi:hypothetical protein